MSNEKEQHRSRLYDRLPRHPFYVEEFIDDLEVERSPTTLLNYIYDIEVFFDWCLREGLVEGPGYKDIPLSFLADLRLNEVNSYIKYLQIERKLMPRSRARKVSSLKSFFYYLTHRSEDENGECYFYRNVMNKIPLPRVKESAAKRADNISKKILHGNDDRELLEFIENEYVATLPTTGHYNQYKKHRERDLAIFALFLASGIRVGELVSLNIENLDLHDQLLSVSRKGDQQDLIPFRPMALPYLNAYLEKRPMYKPDDKEQAFFLTLYGGSGRRMTSRSVQNVVKKYTSAFNKQLSPHKLRHTVATKMVEQGLSPIDIMQQLGHSSVQTTSLYTNPGLDARKKKMSEMDS
ncbi:tyrosine recombinase XerS [Salsuginibacillus kocurii]|uniref:tyrosine recombinase XerS n=1 Tax=Salsuginibacillus kocurii TaxID=427078 RepID=UPI00037753F9|nr:tyrosine recombinase XerS [Salsuginibacillus kocurii]